MQLLCIGDVALADENIVQQVWATPQETAFGDEARILFNWELPVGNAVNPMPRSSGSRFLAHPDSLQVIQRWSPGFATLATNHVMDAGEDGLSQTIVSLQRAGFTTVGAGRTGSEIASPLLWETAEGRLAVVNWVFPETHPEWMSVPGPHCWPGLEGAESTIHELKRNTDWVLIAVHWSDEFFPYPRPEDRAIARDLAQMGADLVVGHHPHVVRGMELIGSCPVFYSVGNYYFSDHAEGSDGWMTREAPRNREGLGVQVSFRRGKRPECRIRSFWRTKKRDILDPLDRAARRMTRVSRPLRRLQNLEYAEWYTLRRARFDRWGYRWHFGLWQLSGRDLIRPLSWLSRSRLYRGL